ncbi:hypothetical protein [Actinomadura rubrisoli]|uniref:hypothetical protein n=1 Tax=Actinomadura rubrisoli TaxID=2530368 RepID=UPI00140540B3|nr:hypothetical protein [Actinomadura rubrisoli]
MLSAPHHNLSGIWTRLIRGDIGGGLEPMRRRHSGGNGIDISEQGFGVERVIV